MGLCQNVYRRGGVYWWRRRTKLEHHQASHYLHLSLKVRDPNHARVLALRVSAEADRLLGLGMLNAATQTDLLKLFIEAQSEHLDRFARRSAHGDAERGDLAEPVAEKIRRERQFSIAYRAVAARGPAARLGAEDEQAMREFGVPEAEIAGVKQTISKFSDMIPRFDADGTLADHGPGGVLGPSNLDFRDILQQCGVDDSDENVDLARAIWLRAAAEAYADTDRRYPPIFERPHPGVTAAARPAAAPATKAEPAPEPPQSIDAPVDVPAASDVDYSISGQMRALIAMKRGHEWKITKRGVLDICDTAEQHDFIARVLIKMLGKDDVRVLRQEHVVQFRAWLQKLPTHFAKSPSDWNLTFDEAIAKANLFNEEVRRHNAAALRAGQAQKTEKAFGSDDLEKHDAFARFHEISAFRRRRQCRSRPDQGCQTQGTQR